MAMACGHAVCFACPFPFALCAVCASLTKKLQWMPLLRQFPMGRVLLVLPILGLLLRIHHVTHERQRKIDDEIQ